MRAILMFVTVSAAMGIFGVLAPKSDVGKVEIVILVVGISICAVITIGTEVITEAIKEKK